jgi:hypothetical protein
MPCSRQMARTMTLGSRRDLLLMSSGGADATAGGAMDPVVEASNAASKGPRKNPMVVIWEFTRPHTIIGSVLSIVSLHLFAASAPGLSVLNLSALGTALLWALVSGALVNLYVTGLNQLFDVEIDKVNKPYPPPPFYRSPY